MTKLTAPAKLAVPETVSVAQPAELAETVIVPPAATVSPPTVTAFSSFRLPFAAMENVASVVSAVSAAFVTTQSAPIVKEPFSIVCVPAAK